MTTLICTISCYRIMWPIKSKIIAIGPLKKSATGKDKYCNLNIYVCIYSIHIYYMLMCVYSMHILYTKYCKYTYTHAYTIYEFYYII